MPSAASVWRTLRLLPMLLALLPVARASELTGTVNNAQDGEPLSKVQVSVVGTSFAGATKANGAFRVAGLPAGKYVLQVSAVGYRTISVPFEFATADESKEFTITLAPDFHPTEAVEVHGDIFQAPDWPAVGDMTLTSSELQQTSTVLADDPLRAVQALPGVSASANNDFFAQFSVMGAPYEQVAIYVDDVLVPGLLHTVPSYPDAPTLSLLTGSDIADLHLMPVAYPARYADAIGAALVIRSRDGDAAPPLLHGSIGMASSEVMVDGGLGRKGTWLLGARKSYIGYLARTLASTPFSDDGFYDANLKLTYDVTPGQRLSLYAVGGQTSINDPTAPPVDPTELKSGSNNLALARLGWSWTLNPNLLVDAHAAFVRSGYEEDNPFSQLIQSSLDRELSGGGNVSWSWRHGAILQAGYTLRRPHQNGASQEFLTGQPPALFSFVVSDVRQDVYVQQSIQLWRDHLRLNGGVRWDRLSTERQQPVTGQVSAALKVARDTQLEAGWGRYSQLPARGGIVGLTISTGGLVAFSPLPLQSEQYLVAVDQRIGERSRFRVEAFDRQNETRADFFSFPAEIPLLRSGLFGRDYSRGLQFVLQRRSENRLSGWIGYTLAYARSNSYQVTLPPPDLFLGLDTPYLPTLQDQRHTVNLFASYRVTPSIRCSVKALYGSGFPASITPLLRIGPYERLDLRADKSWTFRRWKLGLYGELLNATNHDNLRLEGFTTDPATQQLRLITVGGIPITPTAGLTFDF